MRFIKRMICLIAALAVAAGAVAASSCGRDAPASVSTTSGDQIASSGPDPTGSADTAPVFAKADYGERTFTVYMRSSTASHYAALYIYCPEGASDIVNEQATVRNLALEDYYNVKLAFIESNSPQDTVKTDIAGGNVPYDIILAQRGSLGGIAADGLLRNFNELDVDYTAKWWDANAAREYGYLGKLFIMPNDVSVANLAGCRLWWFNKAVLEDFRLKSPYEFVSEDQWTIDNFLGLVKSVSAPGSGGEIGVYGMIKEEPDHLLTGIGSFRVEVSEENDLVCRIATDYAEKTQDLLDKFKAVANDTSVSLDYNSAAGLDPLNAARYPDHFYHARALFSQGHFLFCQTTMNGSVEAFEESEKGIGAVMNPKYDSDQKEYYHQMDSGFPIWCMPDDPAADCEMLGNVMNYWAYVSSGTVMEAYYELTMKTKRATDPTTAEMLDIIKGSIRYYITDLYGAGVISNLISAGYNGSVTSAWKGLEKKVTTELKSIQQKIEKIE